MPARTTWEGSLHLTFRLLPVEQRSRNLSVFLESDGKSPDDVLRLLPYDTERSAAPGATPDAKRYRDGKQVYQTIGLLFEDDNRLVVTEFGRAVHRWLDRISPGNAPVLGRHAASALAGCQLRNPTGAGRDYDPVMEVFPYAFLWRAMLALDNRISSDELNRGLFRVRNASEIEPCVDSIRAARTADDVTLIGEETITGERRNDRIIPWIAAASFGWTLIADKREDADGAGWYRIRPNCVDLLRDAARIERQHREFESVAAYVSHLSRLAAVPPDLR
jgi:hypothetical protein